MNGQSKQKHMVSCWAFDMLNFCRFCCRLSRLKGLRTWVVRKHGQKDGCKVLLRASLKIHILSISLRGKGKKGAYDRRRMTRIESRQYTERRSERERGRVREREREKEREREGDREIGREGSEKREEEARSEKRRDEKKTHNRKRQEKRR